MSVTVLALGSLSEQIYFTLSSYICANKNNETPEYLVGFLEVFFNEQIKAIL